MKRFDVIGAVGGVLLMVAAVLISGAVANILADLLGVLVSP